MFTRVEELSTYNRHWLPPKITRTRSFTWQWVYTSEVSSFSRVRMRIYRLDGQDPIYVGEWIKPTTRYVNFPCTTDDDYFIGRPEVEGGADTVIPQPLIVNSTGKALPVRRPWTAFDRFDITHNYAGRGIDERGVAQMVVGSSVKPAPTYPFKPRTFLPIVNPARQDQMYVRRIGLHTFYKNGDLFEVPTPGAKAGECDVAWSRGMNYFYSEMVSYDGKPNGLLPPVPVIRDGPRGFCTIPATAKFINRKSGPGTFGVSTLGSFFFLNGEYKRTTLGGHVLKQGMLPPHPAFRLSDPQWYADHYDFIGDTSLMGPGWGLTECWSFVVAQDFDEGNTHDFWIPSTMLDEIDQLNHWTAHPAASYQKTPFPPPNYTAPEAPTGQAQWMPFIRNHPLCKQPWGMAAHPKQDTFWYTNYDSGGAKANPGGGGFIARCKRTAATVEGLEIQAVHNPPPVMDGEIGVWARLHDAQLTGPFGMLAQNDSPDALCGRWWGRTPTDLSALADGDWSINGVPMPGAADATIPAQKKDDDGKLLFDKAGKPVMIVGAPLRVQQICDAIRATPTCGVRAWATTANAYTVAHRGGTTVERVGWTARELVIAVKDGKASARTGFISVTRKMYVVDGPLDPDGKGNGASCIHPQDCGFQSDGTFVWAERYPYVIRSITPDGKQVLTLAKIRPLGFAATSSGDNDCAISIDDQDRIYVRTWNRNLVFAKDGTQLGVFGGTLAKNLPPGMASMVSPGDYGWAVGANGGRIVTSSNAGHTMLEFSQRQPGDVVPDQAVRSSGQNSMVWSGRKSMALTHGAHGENTVGGPNLETFGAYADAALLRYFRDVIGIPEAEVGDVIKGIRSRTVDYQYPQPLLETSPDEWTDHPTDPDEHEHEHEEDPVRIAELEGQLADARKALTDAQAANQQSTAAIETLETTVGDLTTQLAAAQRAREDAAARAAELQAIVSNAAHAMAALSANAGA